MQKPETTIPIVGARTVAQLTDSLQANSIELSNVEIEALNNISAIEMGFPHDFLTQDRVRDILFNGYYAQVKK
jgi:diketogulonate reductase-like aldo/keto reductase